MARLNFVAKAAKDNPVCKKGESYFWWKHMVGGRGGPKQYSKNRPPRSRLTMSEYYGTAYDLADEQWPGVCDEASLEEFKSSVEELRDAEQEKLDNMPDGLRDGPTGELLQERVDECESLISDLENVEFPDEPDDKDAPLDEDDDDFGEYETQGERYDAKVKEAIEEVSLPW